MHVAQTLLSVLVMLGTAEASTRWFDEAARARNDARYRQVISNEQCESPSVWHFVSTTDGSVPPWRRIDSR